MPITTVERESPQSNEGREKHENTKTRKHDQKTRSNVAQAFGAREEIRRLTQNSHNTQKNLNQFLCGFCVVRDFFHTLLRPARSIDAEAALKPARRLSTLQRLAMPALTRV